MYKVHQNLGKVYYRKADFEKALESFEKALAICDRDYRIFYDIASTYQAMKDFDKAIHYFKEALRLNQDDLYTLNSLASVYLASGNKEAASEIASIIQKEDEHLAAKLFKQIESED